MLQRVVEDVATSQQGGVVMRDQGRFLLFRGGQAAGRALARLGVGYVQNEAGLSRWSAGSGFLHGIASLVTLGYATNRSCVTVRNHALHRSIARIISLKEIMIRAGVAQG